MEEIANGLDPRVSVIVSAHTHQPYICRLSGKLVTSAASFGRVVTNIDLTIDHRSKQVTATSAFNRIVTQDVAEGRGRQGDPRQVHDALGAAREPGARQRHRRHPLGA